MSQSLKTWLGQVTTGNGFMIVAPTLLAALSGTMSWSNAAPLLTAGVLGLIWPENGGVQSAGQAAATDIAGMVDTIMNKNSNPPA